MIDKTKFRSLESLSDSDEDVHLNIDTKSYRKFIKEERKRRLEELRSKETLSLEEIKELKKLEYKELPVVVEIPEDTFRFSDDKKSISKSKNTNNSDDIKSDTKKRHNLENSVNNESTVQSEIDSNKLNDDCNIENRILADNTSSKNRTEDDKISEENSDSSMMIDYANDLIKLLNNNTIENYIECLDSNIIDLEIFENLIYYNLSSCIKEKDDETGIKLCKIGLLTKWAKDFGRGYLLRFKGKEDNLQQIVDDHYKLSKEAIANLYKQN